METDTGGARTSPDPLVVRTEDHVEGEPGIDHVVTGLSLLVDTFLDDTQPEHLMIATVATVSDLLGKETGVVTRAPDESLQVTHCSGTAVRRLLEEQVAAGHGPSVDSVRDDSAVLLHRERLWSRLGRTGARTAIEMDLSSLAALPLHSRGQVVGSLTVVWFDGDEPTPGEILVARGIADTATVGIVAQRSIHESRELATQLQRALDSRIVIEQAKGVLLGAGCRTMPGAFVALRAYARDNHLTIGDAAAQVIADPASAAKLVQPSPPRQRRS